MMCELCSIKIKMIYNNYHYLGVICHHPQVVTFGRSIFLRECIYSYILFMLDKSFSYSDLLGYFCMGLFVLLVQTDKWPTNFTCPTDVSTCPGQSDKHYCRGLQQWTQDTERRQTIKHMVCVYYIFSHRTLLLLVFNKIIFKYYPLQSTRLLPDLAMSKIQ
jgi:hypothetical protein